MKSYKWIKCVAVFSVFNFLSVWGILAAASAPDGQSVKSFLKRFYQNPKEVMWEEPPKTDINGKVLTDVDSLFSLSEITSLHYVVDKDTVRQHFCRIYHNKLDCLKDHAPNTHALEDAEDRPEDFLEQSQIVTSPVQMDQMNLHAAQAPKMPWSDDYWATYKGELADRYADPSNPNSKDWMQNYSYAQAHNAMTILSSGNPISLNNLSPAEKYDLLVGDNSLGLTQYNWNQGVPYYNSTGSVPTWVGICNGWSAASIFEEEPVNTVAVTLSQGQQMTLYPSDIKGLASLMWVTDAPPVRFVGQRCNEVSPAIDPANGRLVDQACFDTNPGTWHVSIVNELGVSHGAFIMDASYDYQIWNQPVYSYQYTYFNPQTGQVSSSASTVTIPLSSFTRDKFSKYRGATTQSVVGVQMNVVYGIELVSTHGTGPRAAAHQVTYTYDLELDGQGNIIGGEWYQAAHPNFIWTPPSGAKAIASNESALNSQEWNGSGTLPQDWMTTARQASTKGQPLATIVEKLIQLAQ